MNAKTMGGSVPLKVTWRHEAAFFADEESSRGGMSRGILTILYRLITMNSPGQAESMERCAGVGA
jgi:hypothetical protein